MKTFTNVCAQGDVYIRKIKKLPSNAKQVESIDSYVIVTHSETGHHHVMDKEK